MHSLEDNLRALHARIADCCRQYGRNPDDLHLIAVTKSVSPAALPLLAAVGLFDYGENRIEHLEAMHDAAPAGARFHAIGRVQGRQLARIAARCHSLHSLCSAEHVTRLGRACRELGRCLEVFVQVNAAREPHKAGVAPEELPTLLDQVRNEQGLELVGLMCMAPDLALPEVETDQVRRCFEDTRVLAEQQGLARLSMGMSGDFELAIAAGATDLRVGSVLVRGLP